MSVKLIINKTNKIMKKLYYVVEKQLEDIDGFEEATGWKTISVYEIKNNDMSEIFSFDITNEDNSNEEIMDKLSEINYGEENETLELVQL